MRAVVQRVRSASVDVEGRRIGEIRRGLVVLAGVARDDTERDAQWLAEKVAALRVFEDAAGKMNLSVKEVGGSLLVISQFTLLGDCRKGRRPSYDKAAEPEVAERLYERFVEALRAAEISVETGMFRARMEVRLVNDGPVTLLIDSKRLF